MAIFFISLGLIMGSFLNVVILRFATGRSLSGRSACMSCDKRLSPLELIPFFSWVVVWGRCRSCGTKISIQYPLVELITAFLFLVIGFSGLPLPLLLLSLVIASLLVCIAVYDMHHTIIPDSWAYSFAGLSFLYGALFILGSGSNGFLPLLLAGPVVALPLFFLWLVSRGQWMGLGDAKLSLGIGFLLGLGDGLFAILFSFVIGAVVSVFILIPVSRITALGTRLSRVTMKSEIPFGPFLITSCIVVWFSHLYAVDIKSFFLL